MHGGSRCGAMLLVLTALASGAGQETAEEKSEQAAHAMAEERFADAEKLYPELSRADPANTGLLLSLGIARQSQGKHRQAIEPFRAVVKQNPNALPAWLLLGMSLRNLNQPNEALAAFEHVLTLDAQNRTALAETAEVLFSLARYGEAARRFYELAQREPSFPRAWEGLGQSYLRLARQAAGDLEKAAPGSARWFVLRARELAGQGKAAPAFALYRYALSLDPSLRGVHAALAELYRDSGKEDWAAVEDRREAALPEPDCTKETLECEFGSQHYWQLIEASQDQKTPAALYWRALANRQLAEIAFARLAELPLSAELLERRAEMLDALGRHAEAVEVWEETLRLAPSDPRLQRGLARSLCRAGEWARASAIAGDLLRREPESAELLGIKGEALLEMGDAQAAAALLEKAGRRDVLLARAYLQSGQRDRASKLLEGAGAADDGSLYEQLAQAYQKAGEPLPAKQASARARRLAESPRGKAARLEAGASITAP